MFRSLLAFLAASLIWVPTLAAQTSTGAIDVTVMDPTEAVIPGAEVTIAGAETGNVVRTLTTNAVGVAGAPLLPPQIYNISVTAPGFNTLVRNGIVLRVGETVNLRLKLEPGSTTESITVVGETPLLEEKSGTLAHVVQNKEILELPLNGRNYLQLANLAAGAVPARASRDSSFSAYGNSGLQNAFLIDGARNVNYLRGLDNMSRDVLRPPLDALSEFNVQLSNYSAEFGASAGGVVNAITKGGTNDLHGSAYDFLRNDNLDAADFFAPAGSKPLLVRNQYGGLIGGPVVRNRSWFFGAYEGTHIRNEDTSVSTVPGLEMRQGDFGSPPIFDPFSTARNPSGSGYVRTQFPNNIIPASRMDPLGRKIMDRYPAPLGAGLANNYVRNAPMLQNNHNGVVRGDVQVTPSDTMFGRLSLTRFKIAGQPALPAPAQTPVDRNINSWGVGYGYTRTFSPKLVNELRFAWTRMTMTQDATLPRDEIIPGMLDPKVQSSIPVFNITGFAGIGIQAITNNVPMTKSSAVWDISDNVSKSIERHMLKFGADVQFIRPGTFATMRGRGSFGFTGVFTQNPQGRPRTGSAAADLLLGTANALNTGTTTESAERGRYVGLYFQDEWAATRSLTFTLGMRYELFYPYTEVENRMANFILDPGDPLFGSFIVAGDPRKPRSLLALDKNNWGPRVGFAWRVPGIKDMVVRSSYGIFFAQDTGLGVIDRMTGNPPFYGYGSVSVISDQLFPSTGYVLSSGAPVPRSAPVDPEQFVLDPSSTAPLRSWHQRYTQPYTQQWNFNIQKQLPWNLIWQTSYVGNMGVHIWGNSEGNQPLVNGPGSPTNRRPLAPYTRASVGTLAPWNRSAYHGMSSRLEKRFGIGVSFGASFTYGRAIDLQNMGINVGGAPGDAVQNAYDRKSQRGPSDNHVPLRFAFSGVWDLPFGPGHRFANRGWLGAVVGSWQLSAIYQAQSGPAFSVMLPFDNANSGTANRPDRICSGRLSDPTLMRYYNTACFATPPQYQFGNSGRNILYGPGVNNLDFGLHRLFALPFERRTTLDFRAEAFNVANHPQFAVPGTTIGVATAGVISSTSQSNRQLQLGLRVGF